MSVLLIAPQGFHYSGWQKALPNLTIKSPKASLTDPALAREFAQHLALKNYRCVLVTSNVTQWQTLIQECFKQSVPSMLLSTNASMQQCHQALQSGSRGYIEAICAANYLHNAVQSVKSNAIWIMEPYVSEILANIAQALPPEPTADLSKLTKQEKFVAELINSGKSNKEIAKILTITERTVKSHLTNIYRKLDIRDRMQLILYMHGNAES